MSIEKYQKNAVLTTHGDIVFKTIRDSCSSALLLEKHRKIQEISTRCGFVAPELKKVVGRVLHLRRLDLPCSLVSLVRAAVHQRKNMPLCIQAVAEAGRVLACIHTHLTFNSQSSIKRYEWMEETSRSLVNEKEPSEDDSPVYLHGDYALNNVFFGDNKLTVLDPMPNYHTTFDINERGSRYLEIALFVNSIHRQIGYVRYFTYDTSMLSKLTSVFVSQYAAQSGLSIDMNKVIAMSFALDNEIARLQVKGRVARLLRRTITRRIMIKSLRRLNRVVS